VSSPLEPKLEHLKASRLKYELLEQQLQQSGEPQISTTDADARALLVQGQVVEVSYNIEAAVDGEHKLLIATHTINRNDRNALHAIALEAKENIAAEELTVIADKGYHNGRQLQRCAESNLTTIVAQQEIVNSNDHGTTAEYLVTQFVYDGETDTYRCPAGETLTTKGTWHTKAREHTPYRYKKYRTAQCKSCPVKHLCTGRAKGGRETFCSLAKWRI
jgi:radical SAM protein with 4Fe4S-binding SPASM domain